MTSKPRKGCAPLVPPLIPVALLFFAFVWPTFWRETAYEGAAVRVNRLTNEVRVARPGGGWEVFGRANKAGANPPPPGVPDPTAADLARVTVGGVRVLASLPGGLIRARSTSTLDHSLQGDVSFHFVVDHRGARENDEREIRGSISLPPKGAMDIALRTNLTFEKGDRVLLDLRPAPVTATLHEK